MGVVFGLASTSAFQTAYDRLQAINHGLYAEVSNLHSLKVHLKAAVMRQVKVLALFVA